MILTAEAFGLGLAEWVIVAGGIFFALDVIGVSRSSRTIRRQNADLRERNATLEGEVNTLAEKVASLEKQVDDLKSRNVDALFTEFRVHDQRMADQAKAVTDVLLELVTEVKSLHRKEEP